MVTARHVRRLLTVALVLLGGLASAAVATAAPEQYWNRTFGSTGTDIVRDMTRLPDGSTLITGYFSGTVDFGGVSLQSVGREDAFVVKLDASGITEWAIRGGGSLDDRGFGIGVRPDGDIFVVGYYEGTATFGSTQLPQRAGYDIFAMRLSPSGAIRWVTSGGGTGNDYAYRVGVTSDGGFVTIGSYASQPVFGSLPALPTPYPTGGGDMLAAKLDEDGNWVWARRVAGGGDFDDIFDLAMLPTDEIMVTGYFRGAGATFGGSTLNATSGTQNAEAFVAKLSATGDIVWVRQMGGNLDDFGYDITALPDGSTVSAGYYGGSSSTTATFGAQTVSTFGGQDFYITKLDRDGNFVWTTVTGGSGNDYARGITQLPNGSFGFTGVFRGTVAFGGTSLTSTSNSVDIVVGTLSSTGSFTWAERAGGSAEDLARGIGATADGDLTVIGTLQGASATFGSTSLTLGGGFDVFIARLGYGSAAPSAVTATRGDLAATVEWTAPTRQGGPAVTDYIVNAVEDPTKSCRWTSGPLRCEVTGLAAGRTYTFVVTAEYADASSAVSTSSNAITFDAASSDSGASDPPTEERSTAPVEPVAATVDPGRLAQRLRCVRIHCVARGTGPVAMTRVVQRARRIGGSRSGAVRTSSCAVTRRAGVPTYRCAVRLGEGRWLLTTEAWSATGMLESLERRVVIRLPRTPVAAEGVTG